MALKLKISKAKMVRKIDGASLTGYYGRVISNGKIAFDEIARNSTRNTTIHPSEAEVAAKMLVEGISEKIKEGYIVDMGPLGTIYPSVSGPWKQDPDELKLSEMSPKCNYKASDDLAGAIMGASLAWTNATTEETTTTDDITTGNDSGGGDDNGAVTDGDGLNQ